MFGNYYQILFSVYFIFSFFILEKVTSPLYKIVSYTMNYINENRE